MPRRRNASKKKPAAPRKSAAPRKHAASRKPARERLDATVARDWSSRTVPTRWVKFLIGLFLLPPAWILSQTFFGAFAWVALEQNFLVSAEFWFFSLGVLLWLVVFFAMPKPLRVYILGHELTHAVCVWLMGGRVEQIRISRSGGHVIADRVNTLIALAPYFVPIYSVMVVLLYSVAGIFWDVAPYQKAFLGLLGFTWAFHFCFTLWMIPKGQSDLEYGGQFFSLVVIYLANLLLLSALLVLASPGISPQVFLAELLHNTADFAAMVLGLVQQISLPRFPL